MSEDGYILIPARMRGWFQRVVAAAHAEEEERGRLRRQKLREEGFIVTEFGITASQDAVALFNMPAVLLPTRYEFVDGHGDRCAVVAWTQREAEAAILADIRFRPPIEWCGSSAQWPGLSAERVTCPREEECCEVRDERDALRVQLDPSASVDMSPVTLEGDPFSDE